jgi:hypothetical protein
MFSCLHGTLEACTIFHVDSDIIIIMGVPSLTCYCNLVHHFVLFNVWGVLV